MSTEAATEIGHDEPEGIQEDRVAADIDRRRKRAESLSGAKTFEHREFAVPDFELREAEGDGMLHFTGYASITETPYSVGSFTETIKRGAFRRTLSEQPDVVFLVNHAGLPLARTARPGVPGTLALEEDHRGLRVDATFDPADTDAQLLALKMRNKLIDQMSFAFRATDDQWDAEWANRDVKAVTLHGGDVSAVTFGANSSSTGTMRSADALRALTRLDGMATLEFHAVETMFREIRAGKSLSAASMDVLTQVLGLVSTADDAVDEAQPLLAELMGVANPDTDDTDDTARASEKQETPEVVIPDHTTRAAERLRVLQMRGGR